jgi:hypothetical protein
MALPFKTRGSAAKPHADEKLDSMGQDPLAHDKRFDDAGNPVDRSIIEKIAYDEGDEPMGPNIGKLPTNSWRYPK